MHNYILFGLAALLICLIVSTIHSWHRLRAFPGPFWAQFTNLWLIRSTLTAQPDHLRQSLEDFGAPLTRVAPNMLVATDPVTVRHINSARSQFRRAPWYKATRMDPGADSMISTLDNKRHDYLKTRTSAGYAGKENDPSLEAEVDACVAEFTQLLRKKHVSVGADTVPVDMARVPQYFTLDLITRLGYGRAIGCMAANEDVAGWIDVMRARMSLFLFVTAIGWFRELITAPVFLRWFGPKVTDKDGIGFLIRYAKELVDEHLAPEAKRRQTSFIRHGLTREECENEVLLQIGAGSETTSIAIRMTLMYVATAPHVVTRLRKEIDAAHIPSERIVSMAEARNMPYLQAVVYEGLRMHPPILTLMPKLVPQGGDVLPTSQGNMRVPGGTEIGVNMLVMMRNQDLFGEDIDLFRPERFIQTDSGRRAEMQRVVELVFGHGRFGCAGKNIAFMELFKVFFEMFREFDFQVINPEKPLLKWNSGAWFIHEFWMRVMERQDTAESDVAAR